MTEKKYGTHIKILKKGKKKERYQNFDEVQKLCGTGVVATLVLKLSIVIEGVDHLMLELKTNMKTMLYIIVPLKNVVRKTCMTS